MSAHVIFVAPFFLEATLRFLGGTLRLPDIEVTVISQDPEDKIPAELRQKLAGHWRVEDGLDPAQIVHAAHKLAERFGSPRRLFGPLEQLQVPLAIARRELGIAGLAPEVAHNFRDKARMKEVLRGAGVPCARHRLATDPDAVRSFVAEVGLPVVLKPPAGAGGKSTFRLMTDDQVHAVLAQHPPTPDRPVLAEEFLSGSEFSFDSVLLNGNMVWHSISQYLPSPLDVLENDWIQWCVMLPRDITGSSFDPIRAAASAGIAALGLNTGLTHMEWFRRGDGRIAISEVGVRPPGAQFTSLLSYAHDVDFYAAWPRLQVFGEFEPPERKYAAGAAYIRAQGRGRLRRIVGLDEAQRRFGRLVVEAKLPREGQAPSDSYEGDGYIIVRDESTATVQEALETIVSIVRAEAA